LPRQEQPSSIQREEEQELGQLLSNLSIQSPQRHAGFVSRRGLTNDGRLPVRDCSCRGDAAGFARLILPNRVCQVEEQEFKIGTSYDKTTRRILGIIDPRTRRTGRGIYVQIVSSSIRISTGSIYHVRSLHLLRVRVVTTTDWRWHLRVNIESISDVLVERTNFQRIPLSRSGGE